jgi:CO/xanthine dehydrogenase FAD-binding subunit
VRNLATIGGNICTARPSGDTIGPLVAYEASVEVTGPDGRRKEDLQSFIRAPGLTTLAKEEVLTAIMVKTPAPNTGGSYVKYGVRNAMEIAIVSVTCLVTVHRGACTSAKIVLGAVAPTFIRCPAAEESLAGKEITGEAAAQAGRLAAAVATPHTSRRGSAEYRQKLVEILTKRALLEAAANATNR